MKISMLRHFLRLCASALLIVAVNPARAVETTPFVVGVAPHTSARVILEMYQPLRRHLEASLKRPVEVQTAPDFTEFARRAVNQEYDLAITTAHQASLFQTDAGYEPLVTYVAAFKAVALVEKGKIRTPAELKGATVLGLSPTSLVTLWGGHWLKKHNLNDVTMLYVSAADSASRQVLAGEASAAFTSLANYQKLPPEQRERLTILAESEPMPGRIYILNKRWHVQSAGIEKTLWAFAASREGQDYFAVNKLEGFRKLRPRELEPMEPYAAETRQVLRGK
jgi:phosphonate transport system substrate-binding protein